MKNYLPLILIILFFGSCTKIKTSESQNINANSVVKTTQPEVGNSKQSQRTVLADSVVYVADASHLPLIINDEFTEKQSSLILKLNNYPNPKFNALITSNPENMNIRFNQIFLPNGIADGPFSKTIDDYPITETGQIRLRISKDLMASEPANGKFSITIK